MKIFILDKYKITKFNLPEKVEDSFLIPYIGFNDKKDNFVTVEANNDKWQLRSNGIVNIIDGANILDSVNLEDYSSYTLKILSQSEYATIFSLPSKIVTYKLEVKNITNITIGKQASNNISYKNDLTGDIHAEIKLINNEWYIACSSNDDYRTYINGLRVITAKLNIGDVIFINGLKIIWMKNFIIINNPKENVKVNGLPPYQELDVIDNTKYTPVTDEEASVELYKEDEYFYHIPRLVPIITPETFEIDSPPSSPLGEELPFLLTIGTQLTMLASSGVMIYNIIRQMKNDTSLGNLIPQIVLCVAMLFGSIIMPRILKSYQKRRAKKAEKERLEKYKEYLNGISQKIQNSINQQIQI